MDGSLMVSPDSSLQRFKCRKLMEVIEVIRIEFLKNNNDVFLSLQLDFHTLTFFLVLCWDPCMLESVSEPRMVRTEAGHCADTSLCSPSRMCLTFSAPVTRTVGLPKRCVR